MQTDGRQPPKRLLRIKINGRWREDAVVENQLEVSQERQFVRVALPLAQ